MSEAFAKYKHLDLDWPQERILRITFNNPESYNSLDADGHREITYIWRDIEESARYQCGDFDRRWQGLLVGW